MSSLRGTHLAALAKLFSSAFFKTNTGTNIREGATCQPLSSRTGYVLHLTPEANMTKSKTFAERPRAEKKWKSKLSRSQKRGFTGFKPKEGPSCLRNQLWHRTSRKARKRSC